ncbi:phosphopantetheine--transferase domain protein [Candidatus Phytoplasma oryzae]|uniref:ACP synthase n=1 Tax=Candidatus Phytoplasma oryzae TaxID=203274 RepID=A0A139JQX4_9MOLU|nr:4'-phosphopantetheinyl transferase superfamily protein [Candidatus Phytoplasma oryzae]KXT29365.1 phosphopantetheine--transferase domain protein [Candidatus Phytoplasma oryzae]RAM57950.1 ACP synthase [Candidatus Phytoplasma oryzae]
MKNIGIDLIEIKKIQNIGIEKVANRIFSIKEYKIYNEINHLKRKLSFIAGRWAGKKAIFKAYQKGNLKNNYKDWSILNNKENGFPYIENISKPKIMISITHSENYALAFVILI